MEQDIVGIAGSLESCDVLAMVNLSVEGRGITLEMNGPSVMSFGNVIRESVLEVMDSLHIEHASVKIQERGALDCTLRARVETAARRAVSQLRALGGDAE